MTIVQDFVKQYAVCFDSVGSVKVCGRDECKKLIDLAMSVDSTLCYGDIENGFMHVGNMQSLYERLTVV